MSDIYRGTNLKHNIMEKLSKEEFVQFYMDRLNEMKIYRFDTFYDIGLIMSKSHGQGNSENLETTDFTWYFRETGSDIGFNGINEDLLERNKKVYSITITWNSDYFRGVYFATIKQIK